jgi:sugar phosphate permease
VRIEQFQDAIDDRVLGLMSKYGAGKAVSGILAGGISQRNHLSCGLLFIVLTSQLKLWELELFLPQ